MEELKGYDGNLAYEDFDFWVRSARNWKYGYQDQALTKIRSVPGSLSSKFKNKKNEMVKSTIIVCRKIQALLRSKEEEKALVNRIHYEMRQCVRLNLKEELHSFSRLLEALDHQSLYSWFLVLLGKLPLVGKFLSLFRKNNK